jgi:hypothetical protein
MRETAGQSAFTLCADTRSNRIVSTGPVRAVVATLDSMRVCLAAEGFTDSAAAHPRDWASPSRLVVLETRLSGEVRRMQESQVLTSWLRNERPLPNDSTALAWRALVIDVAAAKWDVAARQMERRELEQTASGLLMQKQWIVAQIDTIRHREDSLKLALSERLSRARADKQQRINSARRYKDPALLAAAEAIMPEQAVSGIQDLLYRLDAKGRVATLNAMLVDLDADNRVSASRAALQAIDAQPDPEERLRAAAERLRAILKR